MFSTLNSGEVSIIDVLPGYWYNVRHRFCWNYGGGRPDGVEEVSLLSPTDVAEKHLASDQSRRPVRMFVVSFVYGVFVLCCVAL